MPTQPIQTSAQLAAHLRSLRKSRGLTQAQLGALVGMGQTRIAKIESNPGLLSVDRMLRILAALGAQVVLQLPTTASARPAKKSTDW
jgi:HTH-type transcriptional regulator/antitoxin HipB